MKARLERKLQRIRENPAGREFILADAKDADMCWGIPSPGEVTSGGRTRFRTLPEFHDQIRQIVKQGIVDILLASVSTMSRLASDEDLFARSEVTPAVRVNDTTDVWCPRGGKYREFPSLSFATSHLEEAQFGRLVPRPRQKPMVNLGLYSVTFNNEPQLDREALLAFKAFRAAAVRAGFAYFLEVFAPNTPAGLRPEQVPAFVGDQICRMLAGVPLAGRPLFLKVPFFGPRALEELVAYDPAMIVGIMGGSSGTTLDAFQLLADAQKYGARVALFGRKIKDAEDPLAFIAFMRKIVDGQIKPVEAVKAYHAALQHRRLKPRRALADDLQRTPVKNGYGRNR
jgi:hypothetical protein